MVEWIRRGGCLPNVPELIGELTTPTYTFVHGRFQLEDKNQIKARLGRSPDLGCLRRSLLVYDAKTLRCNSLWLKWRV